MKKWLIRFALLIIISGSLFIVFYNIADDENGYYDLYNLRHSAQKSFQKFLFDNAYFSNPEAETFSNYSGWITGNIKSMKARNSKYIKSEGTFSVLAIHLKEKKETSFTFKVKNNPKIEYQTLSIFLNDRFITKVEVTNHDTVQTIVLPKAVIKTGTNLLKFEYEKFVSVQGNETMFSNSVLLDWFYYDNFQLGKGLKRGRKYVRPLALPLNGDLSYKIIIPRNAVLSFDLTLLELAGYGKHRQCDFIITFVSDGKEKIIFKNPLFPDERLLKWWIKETVDLSGLAGSQGRLVFKTESKAPDAVLRSPFIPLLGNPVLSSGDISGDYPSILMISIYTLRADHLGCYGYEHNTSPNIDKLAADSVLFERHYSASSWTLPSHLSLLTSTFPSMHQNMHPETRPERDVIMLQSILKGFNYYTFAYTTWFFVSPMFGFDYDFDQFIYSSGSPAPKVAGRTITQLKNFPHGSFFFFLHFIDPHYNYNPPEKFRKKFVKSYSGKLSNLNAGDWTVFSKYGENDLSSKDLSHIISLYDGEIAYTDDSLGRLFDKLRNLGLYDNMFIILTSDHGEEFLDHGNWMHTQRLFEEITHVPLIIKFPTNKYRGMRIRTPVSQLDVLPTLLDFLNIPSPQQTSGVSLIPVIKGTSESRKKMIISETTDKASSPKFALYDAAYKYIQTMPGSKKVEKSKLTVDDHLFNLIEDPKENKNIVDIDRNKAEYFRRHLKRFLDRTRKYYMLLKTGLGENLDPKTKTMLRGLGYIF